MAMLEKIRKLLSDNSLRRLLAGDLAVTDAIINEFARRAPLPPPLTRVSVLCRPGVIEIEGEGVQEAVKFNFSAAVRLLGVRVTAREQTFRVMAGGPLRLTTPNLEVAVNPRPGPGLLDELRTVLALAPPELIQGLKIEDDAVRLDLHQNPMLSEQFQRQIRELPVAKKFGINPLDYVEITDIRIEEGAVRLLARRA
jgi:hypothetical protein